MTKTTVKQRRHWNLEQWCAHVQQLGVKTLTEWSLQDRSGYGQARILDIQRDVADALGWLPKLPNGALSNLNENDVVARFKARGVRTLTDMWKGNQPWCHRLLAAGRLEAVAARLGISYVQESHPAQLDYYLARCKEAGYVEAWRQLDPTGVWAARKHGFLAEVVRRMPARPAAGFETRGGLCRSLPELAVCRILEYNCIDFVTEPRYPFAPARVGAPRRADLYLGEYDVWVEVWACGLEDTAARWAEYRLRRVDKVRWCRELGLHLVEIEGRDFFQLGVDRFIDRVLGVFERGGLRLRVRPDRCDVLTLQGPPKEV